MFERSPTTPTLFQRRPLALALRAGIMGLSLGLAYVPATALAETAGVEQKRYSIPAGPLAQSLNRFASDAGITLSFEPGLVAGKNTQALQGSFSVHAALQALLAGTGLYARFSDADTVTIEKMAEDGSVILDTVRVEDTIVSASTEGTHSYAATAMSSFKGAEQLRDIPQSVSVITEQRIKDQGMLTLNDAMAATTGVTVKSYGSGTARYLMRGFELDVINLDGITINNASGTHSAAVPDLLSFERVEVVRGPAGLLQGAAEPGGYINLARKRALSEQQTSVTAHAHSWPGYRLELDTTGALTEDGALRGRAAVAYEDSDSYIDDVSMQKKVVYSTLEYDLASQTTLSIGGSYEDIDDIPYVGVPAYEDGRLGDFSRELYTGSPYNNKDSQNLRLFAELEHSFANGIDARISLNRQHREFYYLLNYTTSTIDPVTGNVQRWALSTDQELTETHYDAYLNFPLSFWGMQHKLLVGANGRDSENDTDGYLRDPNYPAIDVFNPGSADNPDPAATMTRLTDPSTTDTEERGYYLKMTSHLTHATQLIVGGRLWSWETETVDDTSEVDNEFTPYAGIIHELNTSTSVYFSASEAFVPQTATDTNEQILDPRTGSQYELGLKGELRSRNANYQMAVFQITDENRAIPDPNDPTASIAGGKVRAEGFETEVSGSVIEKLDAVIGYAFTDTEQLKTSGGEGEGEPFSPDSPEHSLKLWSKYTFNPSWSAGFGMEYSSGTFWESGDVRWEQSGYTVFSAMAAYQINPDMRLVLNGNNLTDKRYYSRVQGGSRQNYFGDPQRFMLTFEANL